MANLPVPYRTVYRSVSWYLRVILGKCSFVAKTTAIERDRPSQRECVTARRRRRVRSFCQAHKPAYPNKPFLSSFLACLCSTVTLPPVSFYRYM